MNVQQSQCNQSFTAKLVINDANAKLSKPAKQVLANLAKSIGSDKDELVLNITDANIKDSQKNWFTGCAIKLVSNIGGKTEITERNPAFLKKPGVELAPFAYLKTMLAEMVNK